MINLREIVPTVELAPAEALVVDGAASKQVSSCEHASILEAPGDTCFIDIGNPGRHPSVFVSVDINVLEQFYAWLMFENVQSPFVDAVSGAIIGPISANDSTGSLPTPPSSVPPVPPTAPPPTTTPSEKQRGPKPKPPPISPPAGLTGASPRGRGGRGRGRGRGSLASIASAAASRDGSPTAPAAPEGPRAGSSGAAGAAALGGTDDADTGDDDDDDEGGQAIAAMLVELRDTAPSPAERAAGLRGPTAAAVLASDRPATAPLLVRRRHPLGSCPPLRSPCATSDGGLLSALAGAAPGGASGSAFGGIGNASPAFGGAPSPYGSAPMSSRADRADSLACAPALRATSHGSASPTCGSPRVDLGRRVDSMGVGVGAVKREPQDGRRSSAAALCEWDSTAGGTAPGDDRAEWAHPRVGAAVSASPTTARAGRRPPSPWGLGDAPSTRAGAAPLDPFGGLAELAAAASSPRLVYMLGGPSSTMARSRDGARGGALLLGADSLEPLGDDARGGSPLSAPARRSGDDAASGASPRAASGSASLSPPVIGAPQGPAPSPPGPSPAPGAEPPSPPGAAPLAAEPHGDTAVQGEKDRDLPPTVVADAPGVQPSVDATEDAAFETGCVVHPHLRDTRPAFSSSDALRAVYQPSPRCAGASPRGGGGGGALSDRGSGSLQPPTFGPGGPFGTVSEIDARAVESPTTGRGPAFPPVIQLPPVDPNRTRPSVARTRGRTVAPLGVYDQGSLGSGLIEPGTSGFGFGHAMPRSGASPIPSPAFGLPRSGTIGGTPPARTADEAPRP